MTPAPRTQPAPTSPTHTSPTHTSPARTPTPPTPPTTRTPLAPTSPPTPPTATAPPTATTPPAATASPNAVTPPEVTTPSDRSTPADWPAPVGWPSAADRPARGGALAPAALSSPAGPPTPTDDPPVQTASPAPFAPSTQDTSSTATDSAFATDSPFRPDPPTATESSNPTDPIAAGSPTAAHLTETITEPTTPAPSALPTAPTAIPNPTTSHDAARDRHTGQDNKGQHHARQNHLDSTRTGQNHGQPLDLPQRQTSRDETPRGDRPAGDQTHPPRKGRSQVNADRVRLDQIRLARAYLLRVVEPPADAVLRLIAECGPIRAAQRIATSDVPPDVADETSARRHLANPKRDLADAADVNGRLLIPEDPDWPTWALSSLDLAKAGGVPWAGQPIALWIRGPANLAEFTDRAVSLVGARASTDYGERIAAEFGYELAAAGFTVISGAAYGIDGAAHRGALSANGPTIAVLGCGIAVPYPSGHATLLSTIAKTGAVISEYPPKTPPARHRFLVRNRLIAALSAGSVVIEAGRRSGTRNTAAAAYRLGRTVMAVPGPIGSAMSVGCHDLLRTGVACLVASVQDVIESVGRIGADLAPEPTREVRETDGLDQRALRIFDALDRRKERSAERLAELAGVPLDGVRAALPELELRGLAARGDAGWRSTTRKARGDA